jgi:phosphopantothenoylcysteine synthetase/decarboxylase
MPEFHVLLGVTGSVAAVKAPEIALRLVQELLPQQNDKEVVIVRVRVLLTTAAKHFWNQASEYDFTTWDKFQKYHYENPTSIEILG